MAMQLQHQWLGSGIDYQQGLEIQQDLVTRVLEANSEGNGERDGQNHLLTVEHAPVYTIGRTPDQSSLGENTSTLPHPVVEINRGGQATYHGPGQLTGYPIVDLRDLGKDLHAYIRALEEALIQTCAEYGVEARHREGLTGVWVENRKLASIGVGVRKWISMHGFAINLSRECLQGFLAITPCGIDDVTMTCLEIECGADINTEQFARRCLPHLEDSLAQMLAK